MGGVGGEGGVGGVGGEGGVGVDGLAVDAEVENTASRVFDVCVLHIFFGVHEGVRALAVTLADVGVTLLVVNLHDVVVSLADVRKIVEEAVPVISLRQYMWGKIAEEAASRVFFGRGIFFGVHYYGVFVV